MARISTQTSIQQLHSEIWAYSLNDPEIHSDDFVTVKSTITKRPESQLPLASTVVYAFTG